MSATGFFHQPLEFYHGRIPFIVVDLIKRLRELDAETSPDIFNEDNVGNNIDQIITELNQRPIKNWKNYKNVSTLSIILVRYLNSITFDEPLFTNACKDALVEANLTRESSNFAHVFRKNLVNLYPGNYRTILAVTDFLKNVESTTLGAMFDQFGPSFFGKNAIQRNRSQFRILFILLIIHHSKIFKGAVLGPAAYLTPQQIAVLERRIIQKSSSNNSSDKDVALITPKNAVAPNTPKSPPTYSSRQKNSSKSPKNSPKNRKKEQSQYYEDDYQSGYESLDDQDYYSNEYSNDNELKSNHNNETKDRKKANKKPTRKTSKNDNKISNDQIKEREISFNENNNKVISHGFYTSVVADVKPSTVYAEASAQAAVLTMTPIKSIFSSYRQPKKKSKTRSVKIESRKSKPSRNDYDNDDYEEKESKKEDYDHYSDNDGEESKKEEYDHYSDNENGNDDEDDSNSDSAADNFNDDDENKSNSIGSLVLSDESADDRDVKIKIDANESSSLRTTESFVKNAVDKISKEENGKQKANPKQNLFGEYSNSFGSD